MYAVALFAYICVLYTHPHFLQSSHTGCQSSPTQSSFNDDIEHCGDTNMTVRKQATQKVVFDVYCKKSNVIITLICNHIF